jgi:hypothetical protein
MFYHPAALALFAAWWSSIGTVAITVVPCLEEVKSSLPRNCFIRSFNPRNPTPVAESCP